MPRVRQLFLAAIPVLLLVALARTKGAFEESGTDARSAGVASGRRSGAEADLEPVPRGTEAPPALDQQRLVVESAPWHVESESAEPERRRTRERIEVAGMVSTAGGWPMGGVEVTLVQGALSGEFRPAAPGALVLVSDVEVLPTKPYAATLTTRSDGHFFFEGSVRAGGGTLRFGRGLRLAGPVEVPVEPEIDYQVLRFPRTPVASAAWDLSVVDGNGRPVPVSDAELEFLSQGSATDVFWPMGHERRVALGKVEQGGLSVGRWRLTVASPEALVASAEATITAEGERIATSLVVEAWQGARVDEVDASADASADSGGQLWVDSSTGLGDWLPAELLALGENRHDSYFAHTFRFAAGPVRGAQLMLDLEGVSGMSDNDSVYLEHVGAAKFGWGSSVAAVAGAQWTSGTRCRVVLDLARLPTKGGEPADLRASLEDGLLDLVIQDDTVVHAARLRLVR